MKSPYLFITILVFFLQKFGVAQADAPLSGQPAAPSPSYGGGSSDNSWSWDGSEWDDDNEGGKGGKKNVQLQPDDGGKPAQSGKLETAGTVIYGQPVSSGGGWQAPATAPVPSGWRSPSEFGKYKTYYRRKFGQWPWPFGFVRQDDDDE